MIWFMGRSGAGENTMADHLAGVLGARSLWMEFLAGEASPDYPDRHRVASADCCKSWRVVSTVRSMLRGPRSARLVPSLRS